MYLSELKYTVLYINTYYAVSDQSSIVIFTIFSIMVLINCEQKNIKLLPASLVKIKRMFAHFYEDFKKLHVYVKM